MADVVADDNLPKSSGMERVVPASALKNFANSRVAASARGDAKRKNVLLYLSSYELDDGACGDIAKKGGAVVFSFSDVLKEKGFRRAIVISKMRLCLAACRNSGCGFVACSLAKNGNEMRNARERRAFMSVLGMTQEEIKHSEELLEKLVIA
ncbi:Uncharacterised protein [uncultured archaeon]|nr:Uncharacterised protein [uncultured archaeon]